MSSVTQESGGGKFTAGPWRATTQYGIDNAEPYLVWADNPDAAVAHVFNRSEMASENRSTQFANARLIAAAPDMYAALEALARTLELAWEAKEITAPKFVQCQLGQAVKEARAALAKAVPR